MFSLGGYKIEIDQRAIKDMQTDEDMIAFVTYLAQAGEGVAKEHAPVDTGNLRRSITHEVGKSGGDVYGRVGTNVRYGIYQELGTVRHPAHPYLRPAADAINELMKGY